MKNMGFSRSLLVFVCLYIECITTVVSVKKSGIQSASTVFTICLCFCFWRNIDESHSCTARASGPRF